MAVRIHLSVVVIAAGVWVRPAHAQGDDFFRVAPGPLGTVHKTWDNSDGCTKCHKLGGGVTDFLCLSCHSHQDLKKAIEEKHGLHATFKQPCIECHDEHKGRQGSIVDWG
ncbi:MAG: cytochrome c3 family protein, partial [Myxococcota bacterium]